MRVLLTGAFGNLGSLVLGRLLAAGHHVTAFDVPTDVNRRVGKGVAPSPALDVRWGDLRDEASLPALVADQDAIVHVAAVIAPFSELRPELARAVNVDGTKHLLDAAVASGKRPLFVFTSSMSVFGERQDDPPPRTLDDPLVASDHYSSHKIEGEGLVRASGLPWVILRLGAMVDDRMRHSDPEQARLSLRIGPDNRVEYVHPDDVATAIVHALARPEAHDKVHLIGGGPECQTTHLELLNVVSGAMGIPFEARDLASMKFYTDWFDTRESQRLLDYQHHSLADFRRACDRKFRVMRFFVRPFAPLVKWAMRRYLGTA